jgi:ATP-binding protein involved in chromosome partitioning
MPTIRRSLPGVKHIIAVASGKGGVGKSTTAGTILTTYSNSTVNLAVSLSKMNKSVGLLDTDLFGPSIPKMMNLRHEPELTQSGKMIPLVNYGVKCMSIGFLTPPDSAVVWRGLMVMKSLQHLIYHTHWGDLDVLVLDLPPGTLPLYGVLTMEKGLETLS